MRWHVLGAHCCRLERLCCCSAAVATAVIAAAAATAAAGVAARRCCCCRRCPTAASQDTFSSGRQSRPGVPILTWNCHIKHSCSPPKNSMLVTPILIDATLWSVHDSLRAPSHQGGGAAERCSHCSSACTPSPSAIQHAYAHTTAELQTVQAAGPATSVLQIAGCAWLLALQPKMNNRAPTVTAYTKGCVARLQTSLFTLCTRRLRLLSMPS